MKRTNTTGGKPAKRNWAAPTLKRLNARESESGANPVVPEGVIGEGGS